MKTILIAVDYAPSATKIAEEGYRLAKTMQAEIILLHVYADDSYYATLSYVPIYDFTGFSNESFIQFIDNEGLEKAANYFLDGIKTHLGDLSISTIVCKGDFADAILDTAKLKRADIIVIGSHSRRWLDQILMGTVTEKVLRHTNIPLYIIPTKEKQS
jgi:nucleotide-binding universal stress UspA family protein